MQELYLIEDLLFTMMGIEGQFIKRKFEMNDSFYSYSLDTLNDNN